MFKILLALLLMTSQAWAGSTVQWRNGTGEHTLLGSSNAADIDTNTFNNLTSPLDSLLATYCNQYLVYNSSSQLTVSAGSVMVSSVDGSVRLMLMNSSPTVVSFSNIDTGASAPSTTYYVYATASSTSATSATYVISASSTAPSTATYYFQIGSFTTDASSNFTAIFNNYSSTSYVGTSTTKTLNTVYQALTDGDVRVVCQGQRSLSILIYSDSNSSPSTLVWNTLNNNFNETNVKASGFARIRKGDYWIVQTSDALMGTPTTAIYWTPTSK